ncbi:hypothetical protein [Paraburkholderia sacchari]|uniref:Uncharacterized protein n=1 Tax=Paraburkholderia sacchari TaxID=159450 RepID=A0A8T6Z8W6_9BURK|nr:hypothetical protein [Paraburkholderia sacchari]NLP61587.1 hypothetical protein [Paraburkholderia sacchari]
MRTVRFAAQYTHLRKFYSYTTSEIPAPLEINIAILYNCQYYFPSNIATAIAHQGRAPIAGRYPGNAERNALNRVNAISIRGEIP